MSQELRALADMMGRITDQLQTAGENQMGDLPVRLVRRFHKLTDEAAAISHWICAVAEDEGE